MRRTLVPLLSTRSVVLLGAMLIAVALVIVTLALSPKEADAATKLVTKSFSNSHLITIPEGAPGATLGAALPYPSNISASFPTGSKVKDVNVVLRNYSHTFPDDVDVLLVHRGTNRTIMSDVGGSNDVNNITIALDDEASNGHLTDSGQLVGGTFQPTNAEGSDTFDFPAPNPASASDSLSGFDGLLTAKAWKLFVDDNGNGDFGRFGGGWTIKIRAAVPQ
jgi:large repetitive protein